MTKKRFINDGFIEKLNNNNNYCNSRLYITDDIVRYHLDGNIEYIGRNDFQVKINGYRVELGEIEAAINNYPGVKQSVVILNQNESKVTTNLVAYYVSDEILNKAAILGQLANTLPEHMLPKVLIHLKELPLTINGKLDRNRLPEIKLSDALGEYAAPKTELEFKICSIYAEILGLESYQVGIHDDFLSLGGNSILTIKLANKLSRELGVQISLPRLFRHRSISGIISSFLTDAKDEALVIPQLSKQSTETGLSFAQQRLWFIEQYESGNNAYNIPQIAKLNKGVDLLLLEQAIHSVFRRHKILSSLLSLDNDGTLLQTVAKEDILPFRVEHIITHSTVETNEYLEKESMHIFRLDSEYPIRVSIIKEDASRYSTINNKLDDESHINYFICIVIHHIAFDGWSKEVFLRDLMAYYNYYIAMNKGNKDAILGLPELSIQYRDFAVWQRSYLSGSQLEQQLLFWRNLLNGYENLNLPIEYERPPTFNHAGANVNFNLDKLTSKNLRNLSSELKVTLYSLLLSGFYILLHTYSNQDDIVIGTPVANRQHEQLDDLIGFFVNNLVLRSRLDSKRPVIDYIKNISELVIKAQLHQDLPFEKLVEELVETKDESRNPIFQVMFGVQHFQQMDDYGELFVPYSSQVSGSTAKFDLTVMIDDSIEEINGVFNYATSLFKMQTIERLISTFKLILSQISELSANSNKLIKQVKAVTDFEYSLIIRDWNNTKADFPKDIVIHNLFEDQVLRVFDKVAIIYEEVQLTYLELNNRANQLAHFLRDEYKIKSDELIVLCMDRSELMLIAILAVLKSGGAYVPIDPKYPEDRVKHILSDTKSVVVLTTMQNNALLNKQNISGDFAIINLDDVDFNSRLSRYPVINPQVKLISNNLAYVIYTSGTTGKPKGVMIEHQSVVNHLLSLTSSYSIDENENIMLFANYVFDASVEQIFLSICNGGTLIIMDSKDIKDQDNFYSKAINHSITHIHATPSYLETLDVKKLPKLNRIISGGDYLSPRLYKRLKSNVDTVINEYGPTETTITSTFSYDGDSIGKPIANTKTFILDANLNMLPIGAVGELFISGVGLSRGYLNRYELTNERFIPNPYQTDVEKQEGTYSKIYKTGDLVRYLEDGNIEYIGRNDFQVKIRGFRIELGEIENKLDSFPGVKQSVVIAKQYKNSNEKDGSDKSILAYYVSDHELDNEAIYSYLELQLPDYMLPNGLMRLDKLPINLNGKVDRSHLPEIKLNSGVSYEAPRDDNERELNKIYAIVLDLDPNKIGIKDDFFKLGGTSILAIKLNTRINNAFNLKLKIVDIFVARTIEKIAKLILRSKNEYQALNRLNLADEKPILFMIHPGSAGSEVYINLAQSLSDKFSCFGVDSYNLYHTEKIKDLHGLACNYLEAMQLLMHQKGQDKYRILGWSLGGHIAMEIAGILEGQGLTDIEIYLLDTTIPDDVIRKFGFSEMQIPWEFRQQYNEEDNNDFLLKVTENFMVEQQIAKEEPSLILKYTKIKLLKAMLGVKGLNESLKEHYSKLKYNNIEKYISFDSQLELIEVQDASHENILTMDKVKHYLLTR